MKYSIILLIALLTSSFGLYASDKSNKEIKGDKYFFLYSFAKAADTYTQVENLTNEGKHRLAESYKNLSQFEDAARVYSELVSLPNALPEDYYNYAMVLKSNGNYPESNKWMNKFLSQKPNDLRAIDFAENSPLLDTYLLDHKQFEIRPMEFNSNAIDFGTAYYQDQIVFTSSRSRGKMVVRNDNWTGEPYMTLYVSDVEENQLQSPKKMSNLLNSKLNDGPVSFYNDGLSMAFTQNDRKDKSADKIVELQIYFSSNVDGKWSAPEAFILNNKGYSVGHPCMTNDGQTMYFTSDMPGGFGGTDLYKISRDQQGNWGIAENMGEKINTEGDEMFPFFEEKNEILCFASNGRFGLGGLDLFMSQLKGDGRSRNMGAPMNTQYDDFALIIDDTLGTGYFSSNRVGGEGLSDIYGYDVLTKLNIDVRINGVVTDKNDNLLSGTLVVLSDEFGNNLSSAITGTDGAYTFLVSQDETFKLTGTKEAYLDGYTSTSSEGDEYVVIANLLLLQEVVKEKEPIEEPPMVEAPIKTNNLGQILKINSSAIYFDFNQAAIRSDAKVELDKIVKYMNDNPNVKIEVSAFTDCRGNTGYNKVLANSRAVSTVDYIKARITNPERISGKGYGESESVNNCECEGEVISTCTDDEFQENRRTEFLIVK
jgi:outer membrane protein OmpA-like peptidoglycan-associated protein/tetratricopeptide (TPR) repeat protein